MRVVGTLQIAAGAGITVVYLDAAERRIHRLIGALAAADEGAVMAHIPNGEAALVPGQQVSLVIHGRPYDTVVVRWTPEWLKVARPAGLQWIDSRATSRVVTDALPARLEIDGYVAEAQVMDLSPRGARLLVEWDESYATGAGFTLRLGGATGPATIRWIDHVEGSLLAYLGIEFGRGAADLLRAALRSVGAARATH